MKKRTRTWDTTVSHRLRYSTNNDYDEGIMLSEEKMGLMIAKGRPSGGVTAIE